MWSAMAWVRETYRSYWTPQGDLKTTRDLSEGNVLDGGDDRQEPLVIQAMARKLHQLEGRVKSCEGPQHLFDPLHQLPT